MNVERTGQAGRYIFPMVFVLVALFSSGFLAFWAFIQPPGPGLLLAQTHSNISGQAPFHYQMNKLDDIPLGLTRQDQGHNMYYFDTAREDLGLPKCDIEDPKSEALQVKRLVSQRFPH